MCPVPPACISPLHLSPYLSPDAERCDIVLSSIRYRTRNEPELPELTMIISSTVVLGYSHITDRCADCKAPSPRWASISLGKSSDLIYFRSVRRLVSSSHSDSKLTIPPDFTRIITATSRITLSPQLDLHPSGPSTSDRIRHNTIQYLLPLLTGVFLCVQCASVHRKLGTHNSRV